MTRHLLPRIEWGGWAGAALTLRPGGGRELPAGVTRAMRQALGQPTTIPEHDDARGGLVCIQWLGLMIEIAIGRVR